MGNQNTLYTLEDLPLFYSVLSRAPCKAHEVILGVKIPEVLLIQPFITVDVRKPIY